MTPLDYYEQQYHQQLILDDYEQRLILQHLDHVHSELIREQQSREGWFHWLRRSVAVKGIYLWGSVGTGKTFLMDSFYHALPLTQKTRMHFHQFMQYIHQQLKIQQGHKNPLRIIAAELSKKYLVICLDEFFVSDIADAMILAKLLEALFAAGVCLVTTSNLAPDELYKKGLQRQLFLPAIAKIKQFTTVLNLPSTIDYRLRHLKSAGIFFTPNNAEAEKTMEKCFTILTTGLVETTSPVLICGRLIPIKKQAGNTIWFEFNAICSPPRSQMDYLELVKLYRTIFISNVPIIPPLSRDRLSLFIRLIDVLYDNRIRLVASAMDIALNLYTSGPMLHEYQRTCSRLLEMQSENYFHLDQTDQLKK